VMPKSRLFWSVVASCFRKQKSRNATIGNKHGKSMLLLSKAL
jgi:hypothetical protein